VAITATRITKVVATKNVPHIAIPQARVHKALSITSVGDLRMLTAAAIVTFE
jgi:hypothetical protein